MNRTTLLGALPCLLLALLPAPAEGQAVEPAAADATAARLLRQSYTSATFGSERDYFLYLPVGYAAGGHGRWPLLFVLHGDGERGDGKQDLDYLLVHGPLYEAWVQKRELPFVIVAPQLPLFGREQTVPYLKDRDPGQIPRRLEDGVPPRPAEFPTPQPMTGATPDPSLPYDLTGPPEGWPRCEGDLLQILDQVLKNHRVDPDRVYLTGLSYGGFGTWYLASRHPDRFAAIVPVVGWGHPDLMPPLAERQMPVWVFAGGRDPTIPVRHFYPGLNLLERLGHPNVRFTIHEDMGHDAWTRVYQGQDVYDWLLAQRRGAAP